MPWWGSGGFAPWSWRLFLNLRYEKKNFLALYPVSNSHSQTSSRRTNQRSISKGKQQTCKACTQNHPSLWSYVLVKWAGEPVSNSLMTASRRGKQVWSLPLPHETNEWHQSVFDKLMTAALVALKTMADQQRAWGSSLKVVLVVVQCMWQYTNNSPGWSKAEYANVGGSREITIQSWKALLARWAITDHNHTLITVFLSWQIKLLNTVADTHWVFYAFSFPRN